MQFDLEPGDFVINPDKKEWGIGQIQSIINNKVTVMIGPEGDFSNDEINFSINKNAIPISLGENRLRTETAGIFAINNLIIQNHILKTKY